MNNGHSIPGLIMYGGAFDPPHQGHSDCVNFTLAAFPSSQVLVVPAHTPAGANEDHKQTQASFEQRLEMCHLTFQEKYISHLNRFQISDVEAHLATPNYTVKTLQTLQEQHPHEKLGLLVGQDQLEYFHAWYNPREILRLAHLIVVRRDQVGVYGGSLKQSMINMANKMDLKIQVMNTNTEIMKDWPDLNGEICETIGWVPELGHYIFLLNQPLCPASSTMIKKFISDGQSLPSKWLTAEVSTYINERRLYQTDIQIPEQ